MPVQFDSNTLEPLFSEKLLESEVIQESEKDLMTKIETLYTSLERNTGIYYEGSALGSALEAFTDSEDFPHLIQQHTNKNNANRSTYIHCESSALLSRNKSNKITPCPFFKGHNIFS